MPDAHRPRKRRRNPHACDQCNRQRVKCRPSTEDQSRCQNCIDYGERCTTARPIQKRGPPPKNPLSTSFTPSIRRERATISERPRMDRKPSHEQTDTVSSSHQWSPPLSAGQALVMDLTEMFFEIVYPVFPLFHRSTLLRRVARGEYLTDRTLYAVVYALCALSSARVRDGALYSSKWDARSLQSTSSEAFFEAATKALPKDAVLTQELGYMQACVLLAIASIQYGDSAKCQYYINVYHCFVAVGALHDEEQWPQGLNIVEIEERRRLFWSTYTLDVFISLIWKSLVRSSEAAFNVGYPTEMDDETFGDAGWMAAPKSDRNEGLSWITGWNFVTDLYRMMEHALKKFRRLEANVQRTPAIAVLFGEGVQSKAAILDHVMTMYDQLPPIFKTTRPISNNLSEDLFSFQAANIAASMQLLRMVLFTTEGSTVPQKCQIASEVIGAFANIPGAYLRAISSPLLHHLTGIGVILSSAFREGLSESSYSRIRSVLLELAELIAHLEEGLCYSAGTREKLRAQVTSIDEYWEQHRPGEARLVAPSDLSSVLEAGSSQAQSAQDTATTMATDDSPQFYFPPELLDSWSWVFEHNATLNA